MLLTSVIGQLLQLKCVFIVGETLSLIGS